jgi:hypothetical protein
VDLGSDAGSSSSDEWFARDDTKGLGRGGTSSSNLGEETAGGSSSGSPAADAARNAVLSEELRARRASGGSGASGGTGFGIWWDVQLLTRRGALLGYTCVSPPHGGDILS